MRTAGVLSACASLLLTVLAAAVLVPGAVGLEGWPRLHPGLDFEGGVQLVYSVAVPGGTDREHTVREAQEVLFRRLEPVGVAVVHARGDQLIVELTGSDVGQLEVVTDLIGRSVTLEVRAIDDRLPIEEQLPPRPSALEVGTEVVSAGSERPSAQVRYLASDDREALERFASSITLPEHELVLGRDSALDGPARWRTYVLHRDAPVDGTMVIDASVVDSGFGGPAVVVEFDDEGARALARLTEENLHRRIAFVLDSEVVSAPLVQSRITGGRAQITLGSVRDGGSASGEAAALASALRAGSLPAPIVLERELVIEPAVDAAAAWMATAVLAGLAVLFAVAGVLRYRRGASALLMVPMVLVGALALHALFHAAYNVPFVLGMVAATLALAVAAISVAEWRRRQTGERMLLTMILGVGPVAALVLVGSLLYAQPGPLRGAGTALVATGLVGTPLSALFFFALAALDERPPSA